MISALARAGGRIGTGLPRLIEFAAALIALIVMAPLMVLCAFAVAFSSPGPVVFRQVRVGQGGRLFTMFKFRTMHVNHSGPGVTGQGDPRITAVGRLLRKSKLDELLELWNVLRGDMSIVGPRPEVPRYVDANDPRWRRVLEVKPGITDPVTVALRNEEQILARAGADSELFYTQTLLPWKLDGNAKYMERRTAWTDIRVIATTAIALFRSPKELHGPSEETPQARPEGPGLIQ